MNLYNYVILSYTFTRYILVIYFHCNSILQLAFLLIIYVLQKSFKLIFVKDFILKMDFNSTRFTPFCVWSLISNNLYFKLSVIYHDNNDKSHMENPIYARVHVVYGLSNIGCFTMSWKLLESFVQICYLNIQKSLNIISHSHRSL